MEVHILEVMHLNSNGDFTEEELQLVKEQLVIFCLDKCFNY